MVRCLAQLRKDLKLKHGCDEILDVVLVGNDVILCSSVEMFETTAHGRNDTLVPEAKFPPASVHTHWTLLEHVPTPLKTSKIEKDRKKITVKLI